MRAQQNYLYVEAQKDANHHFHPFPLGRGINLIQKASSNLCLSFPHLGGGAALPERGFAMRLQV